MTALLALYLYASHTQGPVVKILGRLLSKLRATFKIFRLLFRTWIAARMIPELVIIS